MVTKNNSVYIDTCTAACKPCCEELSLLRCGFRRSRSDGALRRARSTRRLSTCTDAAAYTAVSSDLKRRVIIIRVQCSRGRGSSARIRSSSWCGCPLVELVSAVVRFGSHGTCRMKCQELSMSRAGCEGIMTSLEW